MNWAIFSILGYVSIALWLCMPLLWAVHAWRRPRGWWLHASVVVGVAAFVLASVNSQSHVSRIQVDRSNEIESQLSAQELARKKAEEQRADQVANIRFAEDGSGDYLDKAGLDEEDLKYFQSFEQDANPAWKQQQQQRSTDDNDTQDLEAMIGGKDEREGLESEAIPEEPAVEPILMSDADKLAADQLDAWNLGIIQLLILLAFVMLPFDYVRRLNRPREIYWPLPVPSRWADSATPREPVASRSDLTRERLPELLAQISRRGESFILLSDAQRVAHDLPNALPRLPLGLWPIEIIDLDQTPDLTDDFVFETAWFARNSYVVIDDARGRRLWEHLLFRLAERVRTRATARQAAHVIWDRAEPPSPAQLALFRRLGKATRFYLVQTTSCEGVSS